MLHSYFMQLRHSSFTEQNFCRSPSNPFPPTHDKRKKWLDHTYTCAEHKPCLLNWLYQNILNTHYLINATNKNRVKLQQWMNVCKNNNEWMYVSMYVKHIYKAQKCYKFNLMMMMVVAAATTMDNDCILMTLMTGETWIFTSQVNKFLFGGLS